MMKKRYYLFLISYCFFGYAQEKVHDTDNHIRYAFSPGVIVQRNVFLESNLFVGKILDETEGKIPIVGVSGFRIGIESDLNKTLAPKIGYEIAILAVTLRVTAVDYFQKTNSEFRVLPELGFCIGGWVNLTYGYGISFKESNLTDIGHHRVSLSFNLNRRLGKAAYNLVRKR